MTKPLNCTLRCLAFAAAVGAAPWAGATVLGFDDLPAATAPFTANYSGFTFGTNNPATTAWLHSSAASSYYLPRSGAGYAVTDAALYSGDIFEEGQPISSATPFVFNGAWFSGINQVRFELYNGSNRVYTSLDSPELARAPMYLASGYGGLVTSVVVVGRQGYFAMDDFTFNSPVPEPTTWLLMAFGMLGFAGIARGRLRS